MGILMARKLLYLTIILLVISSIIATAQENGYKITYTININEDGSAVWIVEYRTLLTTKEDFSSFENYTQQLQSVHSTEFKELMQKSASEAAVATSRNMIAKDFSGDAAIQSTPTGTYGVVHYSFTWTNFAKTGPTVSIGDVFVGGLYLSKDNTLIIQYPPGYTVEQVSPQPDQSREGMMWYGLRSFGAGEPRIVLSKPSFPLLTAVLAVIVIFIVGAGAYIYLHKIRAEKEIPEDVAGNITENDMMDLEDRIVKLLKESGGSLYQSEIGRKLELPKSTVSSALNELYNKNIIQKIKKGRENLIRLAEL